MTGLILKDLLVMRKNLRSYALFLCLYLLLSILGVADIYFVTAMINVIIMMQPLGAFSYDEMAKWDRYAAALPLSRRAMVGSRYLFVLLMALLAAAFGLLTVVLLSIAGNVVLTEALATILTSLGAGLFIADVIVPLSYLLGPERARPYLYLVVFLPLILLFGGHKLGFFSGADLSWIESLPKLSVLGLCALIPLATLIGLGISFLISCRITEKKEF